MKKILVDKTLETMLDAWVRQQPDLQLFVAGTNDELLSLHRAENVNVIISRLDAPGMQSERLFAEIRNDAALREVSLILFCNDLTDEKLRAEQCRPNVIMTLPVNRTLLFEKARFFLSTPLRGTYKVLISAAFEGSTERPFFCRLKNISAAGLLLETDRDLALGVRLQCSFFLPGNKQVSLPGEIVRMTDGEQPGMKQYGMKFNRISPDEIKEIDDFVKIKSGRT